LVLCDLKFICTKQTIHWLVYSNIGELITITLPSAYSLRWFSVQVNHSYHMRVHYRSGYFSMFMVTGLGTRQLQWLGYKLETLIYWWKLAKWVQTVAGRFSCNILQISRYPFLYRTVTSVHVLIYSSLAWPDPIPRKTRFVDVESFFSANSISRAQFLHQ